MNNSKIKDIDGYYNGGFPKIKPKKITIKKEFNENDIMTLDELLQNTKNANITQPIYEKKE